MKGKLVRGDRVGRRTDRDSESGGPVLYATVVVSSSQEFIDGGDVPIGDGEGAGRGDGQ